ncbi:MULTISPECIES: porin family protein [Christiangramia]|uniref:Outer membrane protein beta-barrel domain-containing protein n=1 Tax=Christiangramia flava JLT2011 TaxID=1229726 RepID=A0A1L7I729_9FLAO|nr:porin family protein [Christiangramia flava]APU68912.1 hypothetical protein GRFL_2188 [Christiangramia flava JLT2011]OSS38614.1 hypothetical protein C723_2597 [Christiangramia flava JLT2011]
MKRVLLLIFLLIFAYKTNAQSFPGDVTISPQAGVSLSTYFTSKSGFDPRIASTGGIIIEYYFTRVWSLRSGFIYDQMGVRDNLGYTQKLDYVTVPINANWHFGNRNNFYLNFGPAVSLLLDGRAENDQGDIIVLTDDTGAKFQEYDLGVTLGIGYKFYIDRKTQLFLDYQGFGSIWNIVENLPYDVRNSRNAFNIGVVFTMDPMKGFRRR